MARASTTSDVFNAIADAYRREILDTLIGDRGPPADAERLDRMDSYLRELQQQGDFSDS